MAKVEEKCQQYVLVSSWQSVIAAWGGLLNLFGERVLLYDFIQNCIRIRCPWGVITRFYSVQF